MRIKKVIIDGKEKTSDFVDGKKRVFVGTFRSPFPQSSGCYILCPCGRTLTNYTQEYTHW